MEYLDFVELVLYRNEILVQLKELKRNLERNKELICKVSSGMEECDIEIMENNYKTFLEKRISEFLNEFNLVNSIIDEYCTYSSRFVKAS